MGKEHMNWLANMLRPFTRVTAALSLSCRQASRLQSEALDHKLSFPQRVGLRIHLFLCKWCRRYGKQIRFLRDAAADQPDQLLAPAPQKLSDPARERMKQRLRVEED